jgi:hypothetical protein
VITLEYHSFSPDLVAADFTFFPRLKSALKEWSLCDATYTIKNVAEELKGFHKTVSRNASNTFTVAGRSVYLQKCTILKEM